MVFARCAQVVVPPCSTISSDLAAAEDAHVPAVRFPGDVALAVNTAGQDTGSGAAMHAQGKKSSAGACCPQRTACTRREPSQQRSAVASTMRRAKSTPSAVAAAMRD